MKIKIGNHVVGVKVTQGQVCPAGTSYWYVDYTVDGVAVHTAKTGAIYGQPNALAMLDNDVKVFDHTLDVHRWSCNGVTRRGDYVRKSHRELLLQALDQVISEEGANA